MSGLGPALAATFAVSQHFGNPSILEPDGWLQQAGGQPWQVSKFKTPRAVYYAGADEKHRNRPGVHPGTDYACPIGTNIIAVEAGQVIQAGTYPDTGEHFLMLRIHKDAQWQTIAFYTHIMTRGILVAVGADVTRGQHIAESGDSGESTGPHLHIDIRRGPVTADPRLSYWDSPTSNLWPRLNYERLLVGGDQADVPWITPAS